MVKPPKKKKMIDPSYNDIQAKDIPVVDIDGGIVENYFW